MRRTIALIATSAAFAAAAAIPSAAAADPLGFCPSQPDQFQLFPAMSQADMNKDNNHDGLVCKKLRDPSTVTAEELASGNVVIVQGGPDDNKAPEFFEVQDNNAI